MERGAWWAAVHGVTRVRHDLATKSSQQLDLYTNPIMRVPPSWPNYFPKALPLITITLNVRLSTDEFWDIKKFSPYYPSFGASLVAQRIKRLPAMQETQARSLGWEDPLEKETATHSSTLAWRIPWTEEPGGLQSTGSQRVGHDWVTSLHSSFFFHCIFVWSHVTSFCSFSPLFYQRKSLSKVQINFLSLTGFSKNFCNLSQSLFYLDPTELCTPGFYMLFSRNCGAYLISWIWTVFI